MGCANKPQRLLTIESPRPRPAAALARRIVDLMVFLEDRLEFGRRYAEPGIPDLDPQFSRMAAAAEQNPTMLRVFERVRQQISHHLLEQPRIAIGLRGRKISLSAPNPGIARYTSIRF